MSNEMDDNQYNLLIFDVQTEIARKIRADSTDFYLTHQSKFVNGEIRLTDTMIGPDVTLEIFFRLRGGAKDAAIEGEETSKGKEEKSDGGLGVAER